MSPRQTFLVGVGVLLACALLYVSSASNSTLSYKTDVCKSYSSKQECTSASPSCVWCVSFAIPSGCYTPDQANQLPPGVFQCEAPSRASLGATAPLATTQASALDASLHLVTTAQASLCDDVEQVSGYFEIPHTNKKYFFWFFSSRSDPVHDPLVMWLTGGPGCSSEIALFGENGPCTIEPDLTTKKNPYSWNARANLLYVDQPAGTGFSTGDESDSNEAQVSADLDKFVRAFLYKYMKFSYQKFYLFGESYAGHYVPATAHRIWKNNNNKVLPYVNLAGVSVGNGLTDPANQFPSYPDMAYFFNNTRSQPTPPLIPESVYRAMKASVPHCVHLINSCNSSPIRGTTCVAAYEYCATSLIQPVQLYGWNQYDLREQCKVPPLCYDFSNVAKFLNRLDVRQTLGVPSSVGPWKDCSNSVNHHFVKDWVGDFAIQLPDLLRNHIPVLIYAGDTDFICNWLGNKEWVLKLEWEGKQGFNAAPDVPWEGNLGVLRTYRGLTFLRVKEAGHMVPMDQPAAALRMLEHFTDGVWGGAEA